MSVTIRRTDTETAACDGCSLAPAKSSCLGPRAVVRSLFGGDFEMTASTCEPDGHRKGSTARRSGESKLVAARTLFGRRMRLLIVSGLIAGITPTSIRKGSRQGYLAHVFSLPDGDTSGTEVAACERKAAC
jgi:hypothetical protein